MTDITEPTPEPKLSDHPTGTLVPQKHGGSLRNGGTHKGGPGRPKKIVRASSLEAYDRVLEELRARDLSLATLSELATIGNTAARYAGLNDDDKSSITRIVVVRERKDATATASIADADIEAIDDE